MAWVTPKINWYGSTNTSGVYTGDRFDADDFNRIKNNLQYLRDLAITLYQTFSIYDLGSDRTYSDYFYAEDINQLESNLITITSKTIGKDYGTAPAYSANGLTMDYNELNRLESATLDIYNHLLNASDGRQKFTWNFGMKGGDF